MSRIASRETEELIEMWDSWVLESRKTNRHVVMICFLSNCFGEELVLWVRTSKNSKWEAQNTSAHYAAAAYHTTIKTTTTITKRHNEEKRATTFLLVEKNFSLYVLSEAINFQLKPNTDGHLNANYSGSHISHAFQNSRCKSFR